MKLSTILLAGILQVFATSGASFAQNAIAPRVESVQVVDGCFYVGADGPFNVWVNFADQVPPPENISFTLRNTASGQELVSSYVMVAPANGPGFKRSPVLAPAGNYSVIVRRGGPAAPLFTGYSGLHVGPYAVVTENGKKVCKTSVNPGSGGQQKR